MKWFWAGVVVGLAALGCAGDGGPTSDEVEAIEQDVLRAFAEKHGALLIWQSFDDQDLFVPTYTVDVQAEVFREDSIVAFAAEVNDVWTRDGTYFAALTQSDYWVPSVSYKVAVPPSLVEPLLEFRGEPYFDEHLVAIRVSRVSRPILGFKTEVDDGFARMYLDPHEADVFLAEGSLIGIEFLEGGIRAAAQRR